MKIEQDAQLGEEDENPTFEMPVWCCSVCKSTKIQCKAWIDINTREVIDTLEEAEEDPYYCPDCGESTKIIQVS